MFAFAVFVTCLAALIGINVAPAVSTAIKRSPRRPRVRAPRTGLNRREVMLAALAAPVLRRLPKPAPLVSVSRRTVDSWEHHDVLRSLTFADIKVEKLGLIKRCVV